MDRPFTKKQQEFLKAFKDYGDEIADNGNIMSETGWDRRQVLQVGMGLVRRGILEYSSTQDLGFEGGIWSRTKPSREVKREKAEKE